MAERPAFDDGGLGPVPEPAAGAGGFLPSTPRRARAESVLVRVIVTLGHAVRPNG